MVKPIVLSFDHSPVIGCVESTEVTGGMKADVILH